MPIDVTKKSISAISYQYENFRFSNKNSNRKNKQKNRSLFQWARKKNANQTLDRIFKHKNMLIQKTFA